MAFQPGHVIAGRWEILSCLGSGGMGVVYQARDRDLDELVALKVLRDEMAGSPEMTRRFLSEIKLARRVRHPHVCGIHEYGQDSGLRFIVMEYVPGVDLKRVLAGRPLPHAEAFTVGAQIASALHAIHQAGIVHRDLKPANVMLDAHGCVRLMDFGIAKQFGAGSGEGLTATGQIVGTPEYMSPEQVRGELLDVRSDVYSLGVMVFELFSGRVPFRGPTAVATLYQHVHEPVPVAALQEAGAPAALVPLLLRMLAKSRDERYASAAEVEKALAEAGAAAPVPAHHTVTLVRSALALQPLPEAEPTPRPAAQATAVPAATAVPLPAPTLARRPYGGRAPHLRGARASAEAPARGGLMAVAFACGLGAVGAAVWLYGPTLRARWTTAAPPPPSSVAPVAAPPEPLVPAPTLAAVPAPVASAAPSPAPSSAPKVLPATPAASAAPVPAPSVVPPRPATPEPAAVEATLDDAENLFAQGRFASAMAAAKAVLAREPGNRQAQQLVEDAEVELIVDKRLKEAREAAAAGDRDLALEKLKLGLAAKPTDSRLLALWRELTRD